MARFKLLAGIHVAPDPNWKPPKNDPDAKAPSVTYKQGDTVESDEDLVAKFGSTKFLFLGGSVKKTPPAVRGFVHPAGQVNQGHQETAGGVPGLQDPEEAAEEAGDPVEVPGDGAAKDALVSGGEQQPDPRRKGGKSGEGADANEAPEDLDSMTVAELRELAETEEADLTGLHRKDEIVKAIKKNRRG
jgi:hypothetical protein